jgi:hypothetical protein
LQAAGRAKLEVSAEQAARNQERFADLAAQRAARGLPVAGSAEDKATLARLDVNGKTYYGANGKAQDPCRSRGCPKGAERWWEGKRRPGGDVG